MFRKISKIGKERLGVLALVAGLLVAVSSPAEVKAPAEAAGPCRENPVGEWVYQYLTPRSGPSQYRMVVRNETLTVDGQTYFLVEPTERDRALRAVRICLNQKNPKIEWVVAGDLAHPEKLSIQSGAILSTDRKILLLGDYVGNPFAKLSRVVK
jgi:hypothetical protein